MQGPLDSDHPQLGERLRGGQTPVVLNNDERLTEAATENLHAASGPENWLT